MLHALHQNSNTQRIGLRPCLCYGSQHFGACKACSDTRAPSLLALIKHDQASRSPQLKAYTKAYIPTRKFMRSDHSSCSCHEQAAPRRHNNGATASTAKHCIELPPPSQVKQIQKNPMKWPCLYPSTSHCLLFSSFPLDGQIQTLKPPYNVQRNTLRRLTPQA